ncbi:MAG: hypothetical protein CVU47_09440 [Chloroflexi bacterium HGW-Chloroflexi-9]|nr:MAG: hypothetical protein CVU47_09440 [Chloroflexi bacterium HGW-Chloroflexi-9]
MIDPDNPVVRLVMQSNEAEVASDHDRQRALLREAWEAAATPYERAVAAHYIARIQPTSAGSHHWNRDALDHARQAPPEAVRPLMPSLHLAFAESLERVGSLDRAAEAYRDAIQAASGLPQAEGYARAAQDGLGRVGERA